MSSDDFYLHTKTNELHEQMKNSFASWAIQNAPSAQADLNLYWTHKSKDTFSNVAVHLLHQLQTLTQEYKTHESTNSEKTEDKVGSHCRRWPEY